MPGRPRGTGVIHQFQPSRLRVQRTGRFVRVLVSAAFRTTRIPAEFGGWVAGYVIHVTIHSLFTWFSNGYLCNLLSGGFYIAAPFGPKFKSLSFKPLSFTTSLLVTSMTLLHYHMHKPAGILMSSDRQILKFIVYHFAHAPRELFWTGDEFNGNGSGVNSARFPRDWLRWNSHWQNFYTYNQTLPRQLLR